MMTIHPSFNIDVITNTADTVVANIGKTYFDGDLSKQIVAEYWRDENKFVIYTEVFDNEDDYIGSEGCLMFSSVQLNKVKEQIKLA